MNHTQTRNETPLDQNIRYDAVVINSGAHWASTYEGAPDFEHNILRAAMALQNVTGLTTSSSSTPRTLLAHTDTAPGIGACNE